MTILTTLGRRIRIISLMKRSDKILLIEAFFLAAICRLIILTVPFKMYKNCLGTYNKETSYDSNIQDNLTIKKVARVIATISKYTPWQTKCLVQAMTAQRILRRRKVFTTIYLGVRKDKNNNVQAHAWLRAGRVIVTGGHNIDSFKEVARFGNEVKQKN